MYRGSWEYGGGIRGFYRRKCEKRGHGEREWVSAFDADVSRFRVLVEV